MHFGEVPEGNKRQGLTNVYLCSILTEKHKIYQHMLKALGTLTLFCANRIGSRPTVLKIKVQPIFGPWANIF